MTKTKRDIGYKDEEDQNQEDKEGHGLQGWGRPGSQGQRGTWATRMRKTGVTRTKRDMGYKDEEDRGHKDKEGHVLQGWGRPRSQGQRGTWATRMRETSSVSVNCNVCTINLYHTWILNRQKLAINYSININRYILKWILDFMFFILFSWYF